MNIFLNRQEGRLRAGWRVAAQFFLMLLISLCISLLLSELFSWSGTVPQTIAMAVGTVLSMIAAARGLDRRRWSDYGLGSDASWLLHLGLGFVLAGLVITLVFLIEYAAGWLTITGFGWKRIDTSSYLLAFSGYFLWMIMVGCYEELLFRGYQITNLAEGLHGGGVSRRQAAIAALVLSSVIFGAGHAFNPNASWISTTNVAIAGAMLAIPFILTGRLSWSIGLHIGWNFFLGGIFGFAVSGMPNRASLLQIEQQGPPWLTGGAFGPEAGALGLLAMGLIVGCLLLYLNHTREKLTIHPRLGCYEPDPRYYPA